MLDNRNHIEIRNVAGTSGVQTEVFIDGVKLKGVRKWSLSSERNQVPTLHLDLNALDFSVDGTFTTFLEGYGEVFVNAEQLKLAQHD